MCGIAGVISFQKNISETDVREGRKMTNILKHRGPDHTGEFIDKRCYLGNTRLKIIDLTDRGNLPMPNSDKSIWIAYNGEVTNFRELIKTFKLDKKYKFKSNTDTEVLLYLYEEIGIKFLDYLSGQFALAIYNKKKNKIYIVRDQLGIRPIFYMEKSGKLYFASEIKSFLELSCFRSEINYQAIYDYFSLIYIPGANTPFKDVKELDGGHYIEIDTNKGSTELNEYYKIKYKADNNMTEGDVNDGFYKVMLDSMQRNMISDAPLGMTLSGGIDTSSMLGLAKELGKSQEIHTFSIKMKESSFDESRFQKIMVDYAKPTHHQIEVGPEDVLDTIIKQMAYMDEPNGNGAVIPSYLLAREAKKYVKVLLSGEGGDEISNGYDTHLALKIRKLYRKYTPAPIRRILYFTAHHLPTSYKKLSFDFLAKRFTEGADMGIPEAHLYWRHVFTEEEKSQLLKYPYNNFYPTDHVFRKMFDSLDFDDDLDKISVIDLKYFFICDLMVKNDRTFMAHSIEARFPFADRKVVDFISKVPSKYRIKGFTARYFEKEAMRRVLPYKIYKRKSMGLEMPHSLWFLGGLEPLINKYFSRKNIEKAEIFNYEYIKKILYLHKTRKKDYGRPIWSVLNYLIWFDLFVYSRDYKKYLD